MLPRTKYNRFRNDSVTSVDDLLHNLSVSGGGKGAATRADPAAAPYLVSGEALRRAPDDGPGSLGHLLHKVSHLKLSSSGLRGLSAAARERAGARLSGSCSAPSLAAPDGAAPPGPSAPAMRAARKGRPGDEPPGRAPHASEQVLGAGVTYVVKVGAGAGWVGGTQTASRRPGRALPRLRGTGRDPSLSERALGSEPRFFSTHLPVSFLLHVSVRSVEAQCQAYRGYREHSKAPGTPTPRFAGH